MYTVRSIETSQTYCKFYLSGQPPAQEPHDLSTVEARDDNDNYNRDEFYNKEN